MQMANPHLPPSPGKDDRRPASPRHFWEGWRQYLLGHFASFCAPTQGLSLCGREHSLSGATGTAPESLVIAERKG